MSPAELLSAILQLPKDERSALVQEVLASLDEEEEGENLSQSEWEAAWGAEAERRLKEMEDGTVEAIPLDEALARVRGPFPS